MSMHEIEATLCAMAAKESAHLMEAVTAGVMPEHFQSREHARIFSGCVAIWESGKKLDLVSIVRESGCDAEVVSRLILSAPLTQNAAPYINAVLDNRRHQDIHAKLVDASRALENRKPMDRVEPIIDKLLVDAFAIAQNNKQAIKTTTMKQALDKALHRAEERCAADSTPGIPTGFEALDSTFYGFQKGFVYVLGARTAVGKTTLAVNFAVNAARAKHKTAFVTIEMDDADLVDKMLMRVSRIASQNYLSGNMGEDELDRIMRGADELNELPIHFVEVIDPTLDRFALEAMRLVRIEHVEFLIVDYLQLFETGDENKYRNSREEAKLVSARLKLLARSLNVPILVLSQLNRQAPEDGQPELTHIAETDQIARDADVVMLLYREDEKYYLTVAKQRRGRLRTLVLRDELQFSLFQQEGATVG